MASSIQPATLWLIERSSEEDVGCVIATSVFTEWEIGRLLNARGSYLSTSSMIWEPFYNREYSVTDLDAVSTAYHLILEVLIHLLYDY